MNFIITPRFHFTVLSRQPFIEWTFYNPDVGAIIVEPFIGSSYVRSAHSHTCIQDTLISNHVLQPLRYF